MVTEDGACFYGPELTPGDCQKASLVYRGVCVCFDEAEPRCDYNPQFAAQLTLRLTETGLIGILSRAQFYNERGFQQPLGVLRFRRAE